LCYVDTLDLFSVWEMVEHSSHNIFFINQKTMTLQIQIIGDG